MNINRCHTCFFFVFQSSVWLRKNFSSSKMNLKNIYLKIACLLILAKTYFYFFSSIWFSKNKQVKSFLFIFVWKGKNLFFYRTNVPFRTAQWKISLKAKFQSRHWQKTNDFSLGKGKTAFSQNFGKLAFFGNRNPTNVSFEYFSVHFFRIEKTKQILWKWKSLEIFKTNENSEKGTYMISPCTSQKRKKRFESFKKLSLTLFMFRICANNHDCPFSTN